LYLAVRLFVLGILGVYLWKLTAFKALIYQNDIGRWKTRSGQNRYNRRRICCCDSYILLLCV